MITTQTIIAEIARTQAERRKNWPTPAGPEDADLERVHLAKINALKAELPAPHWGRKNAGAIPQ